MGTSSSLLAPSPKMTTSMMMDPLFFIMHTLAIHQMYTKKRGGFPVYIMLLHDLSLCSCAGNQATTTSMLSIPKSTMLLV